MIPYGLNHLVTDQSVPLLLEKEEKRETAFDYYIDGVNSVCVVLACQSNLVGEGANDFLREFWLKEGSMRKFVARGISDKVTHSRVMLNPVGFH